MIAFLGLITYLMAAQWLAGTVAFPLGYIAQQPILDFAGQISPEAIPIIRNESALLELAPSKNTRLLVTFADWYPQLVQDERLKAVHATNCPVTKAMIKKLMTVYQLRKD